jgi:uncharacterized protein
MPLSRRQFLHRGALSAVAIGGCASLLTRGWAADSVPVAGASAGFGPLIPDPRGVFDLPAGFSYQIISRAGDGTGMGYVIPGAFAGMGAFSRDGLVVLVRNHELSSNQPDRGPFRARKPDPGICYDDGAGISPCLGGTSTVVWDPLSGKTVRQYLSLLGTARNCAGGVTPWGSWITCEQTTEVAGPVRGKDGRPAYVNAQEHGFAFEVPASVEGVLARPEPLRAMGRFRREAVAVQAGTGIVYQTEDDRDGVFYRFLPAARGRLAAGGRLQALRISSFAGDTTNWERRDIAVGQGFSVDWVDVRDPRAEPARQAGALGATRFTRGAGITLAGDRLWFTCIDGGAARKGQIWQLEQDRLTLFCESDDAQLLKNGDNLTLAPWGDLIVCEDAVGAASEPGPHLVGVTPAGQPYHLGKNRLNQGKLAGVCGAPGGRTLFVNLHDPGLTLAISGPWPQ